MTLETIEKKEEVLQNLQKEESKEQKKEAPKEPAEPAEPAKEEQTLKERKEAVVKLLTKHYTWISLAILALIVWLSVYIRTRNLSGLRDITTNSWTLGPDLDPFLFLRWAKDIVAHGSLAAIDTMRNSPLGFNTKEELLFLPHLIAWFHKLASLFGSTSVDQSAALFPVFMFALTVIAFFLLTRKIFVEHLGETKADIIALSSSLFLSVLPSLLPRTIAGIPEKESAGFLFMFLAFYFFLCSWKSSKNIYRIIFALLSAASTAAMAMVWGGFIYIFLSLAIATFLSFILENITKEKFYTYSIWLFASFAFMYPFSVRYSITNIMSSTVPQIAISVFLIMAIHFLLFKTKLQSRIPSSLSRIPKPLLSIIIAAIVGILLATITFGPKFIIHISKDIIEALIHPFSQDRFSVTVAENRMPYFSEWAGNFGPFMKGVPLFFWLFFAGSIYLYSSLMKVFNRKECIVLTTGYTFFLFALIFSRYSRSSVFNGENFQSNALYFGGMLVLLASFVYYYYKYQKAGEQEKFKSLDFGLIFLFALFFLSIVSARGGVRLIMMLVPPTSIIVSYLAVASFNDAKKVKDETLRIFAWIFVILIILLALFSAYQFYKQSISISKTYVPNEYTQQWQKAMFWVRENTPENSVFGHWWDYGYWLQSIGNRATVLDGGNAIVYWNYMMGRYALTGADERKALEYLYAHKTTHFLIDQTDIGKYSAFSSIGSDENLDRLSWINLFARDNTQSQETKNTTIDLFTGGAAVDGDIIYDLNGARVFLPGQRAGIGAIKVERTKDGQLLQPYGIFVYEGKQYLLPLRYAYDKKLIDFGLGLDAGIFLLPRVSQTQAGGVQIEDASALLYLSSRTVQSMLARLYLFGEETDSFKIAHVEDDYIVSILKSQGAKIQGNFIDFQGSLRGPIKIWEIKYPKDIDFKEEYLSKAYPTTALLK